MSFAGAKHKADITAPKYRIKSPISLQNKSIALASHVKIKNMPHNVARKIRERAALNEPFVVVSKNGKPSRTYGLEEYLRMQKHPLRHKPWNSRAAANSAAITDPLGAIPGKPRRSLSRQDIYEE